MPGPASDALVRARVAPIRELVDPADPASLERVANHVRERGIRVVVPQVATDLCRHIAYFSELLRRLRAEGIAVVGTLHNVLPHDVFPVDREALAALYALCDGYLVGNEAQRALLFEHFGVGGRPVAIAPQGPYVHLDLGRHDRASARRLLRLPERGPGVLYFGNARPNKGLDLLVAAIPRIRAERPDAFVYVSTTAWLSEPGDQVALEAKLASLARQPGVFVRFAWIPSDEIEPTFRACDVVALPYRAVSQSAVVGVARAFRRPCVATEVFRRADRLAPGEGRLSPATPEAFADALLAELDGEHAAPAPDESPWDRNADALERVCAAVLPDAPSARRRAG